NGDRDRDVGLGGRTLSVTNGVGEAVDAGEVRLGHIADRLVGQHRDRTVRRGVDADDPDRVAVQVVVVGEDGYRYVGADLDGGRVVCGDRGGVRPCDEDLYVSFRRPAHAVPNGVGKAVDALERRSRRVGEGVVGIEGERTGGGLRVAADGQIAALVIA